MAGNVPPAPTFSRRVHDAQELLAAISDAVRATGVASYQINFNGVVRLDREAAGEGAVDTPAFILSVVKRN